MRVQMLAPALLLIVSTTPVMLLSQLAGAPEDIPLPTFWP